MCVVLELKGKGTFTPLQKHGDSCFYKQFECDRLRASIEILLQFHWGFFYPGSPGIIYSRNIVRVVQSRAEQRQRSGNPVWCVVVVRQLLRLLERCSTNTLNKPLVHSFSKWFPDFCLFLRSYREVLFTSARLNLGHNIWPINAKLLLFLTYLQSKCCYFGEFLASGHFGSLEHRGITPNLIFFLDHQLLVRINS